MDNTATTRHRKKKILRPPFAQNQNVQSKKKKQSERKSGIFRILIRILTGISCFIIGLILAIILIAFFTKSPIDADLFSLPEPPEWNGPLAQNLMLQQAMRLFEDKIIGPEAITYYNGSLFTGTADGRVLQIVDGIIKKEWKFGTSPCSGSYDEEPTCGRPLGMRVTSKGTLIVADAYLGIFEINLETGKYERILPSSTLVGGRPLNFLNDLDIMKDGTILFSDTSKWDRRRFMYSFLENRGDGRLMSFNPTTKKMTVLLENLYFANGVQLAPDESYVLVAETGRARIKKYYFNGPKQGQTVVFKENLPFFPDNIRLSTNRTFWIGGVNPRRPDALSLLDMTAQYPKLRTLLVKIVPAKFISKVGQYFTSSYGLAVQMDENGNYVSTLHDPTGLVIKGISHVCDTGNELYFGSFHAPFLAVLKY